MVQLFGRKQTYLYGKIRGDKFITPSGLYQIEPLNMVTGMHPAILTDKVEVFYLYQIFNSYLISEDEEGASALFSVDGKTTITRDRISSNTLYTFKIVRETESIRMVELYNSDVFHPGFKTKGDVVWKQVDGATIPILETKHGSGRVLLQNNDGCLVVNAVLYRKDRELHFVQVDKPVEGVIELSVTGVGGGNKYNVANLNVRGTLFTSVKHDVGDMVGCVVKEVFLGYYIFSENVELKVGLVIEAKVKSRGKNRIFVTYEGRDGYMPLCESSKYECGKWVRGIIYDICNGLFLLSTKRLSGCPPTLERVDLSVPFDIKESKESSVGSDADEIFEEDTSLAAERKRAKTMNEVDFLMGIKAYPREALPVIKYIQYKMEINEMEAPRRIFEEFLPEMSGREKDKLCISFVNYLLFTKDDECLKVVKRLEKICSPGFLETIASNTEDIRILKLCFERLRTKKCFERYLYVLLKEDSSEADKFIEKNKEFLSSAIPLIYKHRDNPRVRIERMLVDKKDVWRSYLKCESGEYLRSLYRRVVDKKWKVSDAKMFYKMWLDYENENNGNIEEVKQRAQEYVNKVKNNNCNSNISIDA